MELSGTNFSSYLLPTTSLGLEIGYAIFVSDNVSIEPAVRWEYGFKGKLDGVKTLSFSIGLNWFFD